MLISNTAQYAIRILLYMAAHPVRKYSAAELIHELDISDKYLRKIMTGLAKAGFINSTGGRQGGYIFEKPVNEIRIGDIVFSIEGKEKYMKCMLGFEECSDEHPCKLHSTWLGIRNDIFNILNNTSLESLRDVKATKM